MLTNKTLLQILKESFKTYLERDTSRSTAKLKSLHGSIARDIHAALGKEYCIQAQGYETDKEGCISGRYYTKNVDIAVTHKDKPIAAFGVKFVMRNYSQNSNNYFENMLGETANIRANNIPYFQIFIIFDQVPYYENGGKFKKYDIVSKHHLEKYLSLSKDNPDRFFHTPDKTLFILLSLKDYNDNTLFENSTQYAQYYLSKMDDTNLLTYSNKIADDFDNSVILNNYEDFILRSTATIKGKGKA